MAYRPRYRRRIRSSYKFRMKNKFRRGMRALRRRIGYRM